MLFVQDPERDLLDLRCQREEIRVHPLAHGLEDLGSRVVNAVDPMSEAHEPHLPLASCAHPGLGVLRGSDQLQLFHDLRGSAYVRWTFERADGADEARSEIRIS